MSCCGGRPSKSRPKSKFKHLKPKAKVLALRADRSPVVKSLLMCRPSFYGIEYQINPWMDVRNAADRALALAQWQNLVDRLREHGADVQMVKPQPGLPDMVFTANAGLTVPAAKRVVVSHFRHAERKGEEEWFVKWFAEAGWDVRYPTVPFEGAGDALVMNGTMGGTLFCGHGFRSDPAWVEEMTDVWDKMWSMVRLVDPRFYHLDTCFCPLGGADYLIYPAAFDDNSLANVRAFGEKELAVPEDEALRFACNAVVLGKTVVVPSGCPVTEGLLRDAGYAPVAVDVSEFIKAGGACKCLTLEIG
jgi:N-dimethylarginine dimethylaminohydrolase